MSAGATPSRAGVGRASQLGAQAMRSVLPHRGMPLRRRVSMAAAAAVAIAVALAVVVCYVAVSYRLHSELHSQLKAEGTFDVAALEQRNMSAAQLPRYQAYRGGSSPYRSIVFTNGASATVEGSSGVQPTAVAVAVARGTRASGFADITVANTPVCVYIVRAVRVPIDGQLTDVALVLGRPLTQSNSLLHELRLILLVVFLFAVPLAALFGRFAARRVLRPLAEVTNTADTIARTDDLSKRIEVREDDEVGQLASRFNAMLERLSTSRAELDDSVRSQRQLVADASHELRTPVTSLRTNVEVLLASPDLPEDDRALLNDVLEQTEELSTLVADLIEVGRGELPSDSLDDVRLDGLVQEALVRARRNAPATEFRAHLEPTVVQGSPERLSRAINNLIDNAVKHGGGGGPVEVRVDVDGLAVRDHGGGIDPDDLPHLFDRFYRGINSRSTQGSGLGLAIVRQTALLHGGSVRAANAPDGGAIFTLELPTAPPADLEDQSALQPDPFDADGDGRGDVPGSSEDSPSHSGALWS